MADSRGHSAGRPGGSGDPGDPGGSGDPGREPGREPGRYAEPKLNSLYKQLILEHYKSPRNRGEVENPTVDVHMHNPTCGDEIRLTLKVENGRIAEVRHQGQGCSISQASVSMMSQLLEDRPLDDAGRIAERFTEMMHGDEEAKKDRSMGNLRALAGVSKFPVRVKCALLGFDALQEALKEIGAAT